MANYNSLKNAGLTKPSANVSLGSDTSRYTDIFLSGNVNIAGTSLTSTNAITPRIATIAYVGDDTAAAPAGGQTITLTGSGFVSSSVYVGGTIVASVSVVNSTQLTFVAPAKTAGSYSLNVVNSDGASATFIPGMQYSGVPTWSTSAGSLGSVNVSTSVNFTVAATSDSTVTYSVTSGSLPSGVTLNSSTGAITGTAPSLGSTTTYNFTIRATDSENQDTDRNFSMTVALIPYLIDYLIVAGGGGSNREIGAGGGGGAGGYLTTIGSSQYTVSTGTTYNIVIGAGGGTTTGSLYRGLSGSNSTAFGLTAYGGGYWGFNGGDNGGSGGGAGSAGGQGKGVYPGSTYIDAPRQGYDGHGGGNWGAGGGAGGAGSGTTPGPGVSNNITGSAYTYCIGGEGYTGTNYSDPAPAGSGTYGKGGDGSKPGPGGTGNGIVVVRYSDTLPAATSTTGSPTYTVTGGYRRYVFTASGSITF